VTLRNRAGRRVSAATYKREVLETVSRTLDAELRLAHEASTTATALDQLRSDELAHLLLTAMPVVERGNKLAELVGPCYRTSGVQTVLGRHRGRRVTKQAIDDRRRRGTLLALQTSDHVWVYPVWQFADAEVRPEVSRLLDVFGDSPRWSVAGWFCTPALDLHGATPLAWLDNGGAFADAESLAARTAARWAA
jgi:hypothetical protein